MDRINWSNVEFNVRWSAGPSRSASCWGPCKDPSGRCWRESCLRAWTPTKPLNNLRSTYFDFVFLFWLTTWTSLSVFVDTSDDGDCDRTAVGSRAPKKSQTAAMAVAVDSNETGKTRCWEMAEWQSEAGRRKFGWGSKTTTEDTGRRIKSPIQQRHNLSRAALSGLSF